MNYTRPTHLGIEACLIIWVDILKSILFNKVCESSKVS